MTSTETAVLRQRGRRAVPYRDSKKKPKRKEKVLRQQYCDVSTGAVPTLLAAAASSVFGLSPFAGWKLASSSPSFFFPPPAPPAPPPPLPPAPPAAPLPACPAS
eukprot:757062-Rhodomonas_salina.2